MRHYVLFFLLFLSSIITAQDEYLINSSGNGDYTTISSAISDLEISGLSKDVVFYIEGEFTEQLDLTNNIANSDSYQIIFISVGDPDEAIIIYEATSASDNFLVNIAGEKVITFQNLTFIAKGKSYSRIINSDNPQGNLTFIGNEFHGNLSPGTNFDYNIVHLIADNSSENLNNIIFDGNQFYGGYHALYLDSFNSPKSTNLNIHNNNYFESCFNGISIKDFDAPIIENNEFTQISSRIIFLEECINTFSIKKNKTSTVDNGTTTGIEINLSNGTSSNRGIISNNFIQSNENGIVVNNSDYIDFYFNTVNIENMLLSDLTSTFAFSHDDISENLNVINNIFNNYRKGYSLIGHKVTTNNINYNNFFTHGNFITNWNGNEDYTDLQTFQTSTSTNTNSFEEQVTFVSRTDLHIQSSPVDLDGLNISSISNDIDGDLRNNPPFIGADEYELPISGPLNGIYTIGISGDFETIVEAVDSLYSLGIDGAVTFNILNGIYSGQIYFNGPITGSSATNKVTFQSASGNPSDVELNYQNISGLASENQLIYLNDVSNLKFKNITFSIINSTYGEFIDFSGEVVNIKIDGNIFDGDNVAKSINSFFTNNIINPQGDITIINNIFNNTTTSILLRGLTPIENLIIDSNEINATATAIDIENGNSIEITGNNIEGAEVILTESSNISFVNNTIDLLENSANYALDLENCSGGFNVTQNKIFGNSTGIRIYSYSDNLGNKGEINNNFISGEGNGLLIAASHDINIYFNTIIGAQYSSTCLNIWDYGSTGWASRLSIMNNLLVNLYGSRTIKIDDVITNLNINFNNHYSDRTSNFIVDVNGTEYTTIQDYQTVTNLDLDSYNESVTFVDNTSDFHLAGYTDILLGTSISGVTTDFDGELRGNPPFIGADEPPPPLSGTYTIGSGGDYTTISEVIHDLYWIGVSGEVIFNLSNGTYTEQMIFGGEIPGASLTNNIIFQSASGNRDDVKIRHNSTSESDNFVLRINNSKFINIRNLTFEATNTDYSNNYSKVVSLENDIENIELDNNKFSRIYSIPNMSAFFDRVSIIFCEDVNFNNILFTNNIIENGYYGLYFSATSGSNLEMNDNIFNGNAIGMYLVDIDSPSIIGNTVFAEYYSYTKKSMGIFLLNCINSIDIERNEIYANKCITLHSQGTTNARGKIFNNILNSESVVSNPSVTTYPIGIEVGSSSEYFDIFYNTINIGLGSYTSGNSKAINLRAGHSNVTMQNNIISNFLDGYSVYDEGGVNFNSDYNNLYTNGINLGYTNDSDVQNFNEFISLSGTNQNSYNELVTFVSDSNLHISAVGTPLLGTQISGITTDIDGDLRNNPPFIGADEPTFQTSTLTLNIFLEGPYNSGINNMNSTLTVPTTSPFTAYIKVVDSVPANVVDWVLVKLVDENDQTNVIAGQSSFLLEDGSIVSADDLTPLKFTVTPASYYVVVEHRNHLSVMSYEALNFN